jgi:hypothetical protein
LGRELGQLCNPRYTAVTRAERVCVVVGDRVARHTALARRDADPRHTRLAALVAGADREGARVPRLP